MKVYTDVPDDDVSRAGPVVVLMRRAGAATGFLFGLGLLALLMASHASAESGRQDGRDAQPRAERSLLGTLSPVTAPVGQVLEPAAPVLATVTGVVEPVVRPVAHVVEPITEVAKPVLRPVAQVVAPVLAPVLNAVTPVLDAVAPVTEPVTGPLLDAVRPVTEPVTEAVGRQDEASEVTEPVTGERLGLPGAVAPQGGAAPSPQLTQPWVAWTAAPTAESLGVHNAPSRATVVASPLSDRSESDRSGQPGQVPNVPDMPAGAVPGGSGGSVGGAGGPHGGDAAVPSPGGSSADDSSSGRGPPGAIDGLPWVGYDQPDCPG